MYILTENNDLLEKCNAIWDYICYLSALTLGIW